MTITVFLSGMALISVVTAYLLFIQSKDSYNACLVPLPIITAHEI
ncbi:MAG TPA: hypothetical protein V6D14_23975 [Coleofasciculaceae cyanobacterium]